MGKGTQNEAFWTLPFGPRAWLLVRNLSCSPRMDRLAFLAAEQFCMLQVGLGKKKYLYALEEGVVRYTKEVYVPHPSNSEAVDLVTRLPKGAVLYKTFVHVVPAKPEGTFKLVDMLWAPGWSHGTESRAQVTGVGDTRNQGLGWRQGLLRKKSA